MNLYRFHGGLKLAEHKQAATASPLSPCPAPTQYVLPLQQHAGAPAQCVVSAGQTLRRGELIARAAADLSAAVHAPTSGTVSAITSLATAAAPDGEPCVILDSDGCDESVFADPLPDWRNAAPALLCERIAVAGIVGLGGAAFPTAPKLAGRIDTLILNGAECEPYIACDETLLRERAAVVIDGALLLRHACSARRVVIAVEERMGAAFTALAQSLSDTDRPDAAALELVRVPTIYPAGGERQLIRVLTGREVPSGGLPRDIGVLCVNVGTAAASWRAVVQGEALTERIVSVTGRGVRRPGNFIARIGTPVAQLVEAAGGYSEAAARLIMGGPMMGVALPNDAVPIVKATNCVLVLGADDVRERAPELPCIRCGECAEICPAQLLPQQLLAQLKAGQFDVAAGHGLFDCIECGLCAYVCPSQIPLVDWYRHGKSELRVRRDDRARADHARDRFQAREVRQARNAAERVARVSAREQERESAASPVDAVPEPAADAPMPTAAAVPPMDKAAVLAAIARGRAKKHTRRDEKDGGE